MKKIVFGTLKGGTGKTMTTFTTSWLLAEMGKKVLAVDVDPQANLSSNFNISEKNDTIIDVFEIEGIEPHEVIRKTKHKNIDLIPSNVMLTSTEMKLITLAGREYILSDFINDNLDYFENEYDYILIDTNPSMSVVNQNAFIAADAIILVNEPGQHSLDGSKTFMKLWSNITKRLKIENNIKGFLINRYRKCNIADEFIEFCNSDETIKELLFKSVIPTNVKLTETEVEKTGINLYSKRSKGYAAYKNFVNELIERV